MFSPGPTGVSRYFGLDQSGPSMYFPFNFRPMLFFFPVPAHRRRECNQGDGPSDFLLVRGEDEVLTAATGAIPSHWIDAACVGESGVPD